MKRLLVLFVVLVPLSLFIAGCGDKGGSSGKTGTEMTPEREQEMKEMMRKGKAQMEKNQGGKAGQ